MPTVYKASDLTRAARRCSELARRKPHWPRARVRRVVAQELQVSTITLRYLLRRADAVLGTAGEQVDSLVPVA